MLDHKADPDVPIRLLRNNKGYRFYGVVHEHCERAMDDPISPAMMCMDVNIAHYGYMVEPIRRDKCANRNLPLLMKDRRQNPQRKLGMILEMRDYINMSNWSIEAARGMTEEAVKYLREVVRMYLEVIPKDHRVHVLSLPMYQGALATLGRFGVPITDTTPTPPFEAALVLVGSFGGLNLPEGATATPERRWFATPEEHLEFLQSKQAELTKALTAGGR
jgi:hypothetical protein